MSPVLPPLGEVIRRYELATKKSLGQHFLLQPSLTDKIARAAGDLTQTYVIEIGPGPGGLTRSLLAAGAHHVMAVEKDARCMAALTDLAAAYPGQLTVSEQDALTVNLPQLTPAPRAIVANLPYNVATELVLIWLKEMDADRAAYTSLTLMFQKEVAQRLSAEPGSKAYGRLSVMTQWRCRVMPLFDVRPEAFTPPPKVMSQVVQLLPRAVRDVECVPEDLEQLLKAGFGQRRKMLRQSLKSFGTAAEKAMLACGLDGTQRAETLSPAEWVRLAAQYRVFLAA